MVIIPMSGIEAAAGGVLSARSNSSTKNATNTLIPVHNTLAMTDNTVINLLYSFMGVGPRKKVGGPDRGQNESPSTTSLPFPPFPSLPSPPLPLPSLSSP